MGVGDSDPAINPFLGARLPTLRSLLGGGVPTLDRAASAPTTEAGGRVVHLLPLDATLEVEGLPQSGTGQATLLTGQNCAVLHGHHFGPWVPVGLRPLVQDESWLRRAADGHADGTTEVAYELEVDSLGFLSVDGLYQAMDAGPRDPANPQFTDHYFTGDYPTRLLDREIEKNGAELTTRQLSLLVSA